MTLTSLPPAVRLDVDQFVDFCSRLVLEDGSRMVVHEFQRTMLADYFDGATETLILVSKKNGKTSLLAALALFHLVCDRSQRIFIAAASRDQATILFDQAAGLVRRSRGLDRHVDVKPGYREIRSVKDDGVLKVLSADADTADGVIPTLVFVDELHRHKTSDLYGVLRDGLGPRGGRIITISTAGTLVDSPLGVLRDEAYELGVSRDGAYRYARSADGGFAMHEWALEPDADVDDMELVKTANPAPWHTIKDLQRRHDSPSTTAWQWKRFACGIWTEGDEPWIDPLVWDARMDARAVIPDGSDVIVGIDLGFRHDTTAVAVVWPDGERLVVKAHVIPPNGETVRYEDVEAHLATLMDRYRVRLVVYDRWQMGHFAEMLQAKYRRSVWEEFNTGSAEKMAAASANLFRVVHEGRIVHDGDPVLRAHVMAGVTKNTERGWRLVKDSRGKRPIDALIAMCIAVSAVDSGPGPSRSAVSIF